MPRRVLLSEAATAAEDTRLRDPLPVRAATILRLHEPEHDPSGGESQLNTVGLEFAHVISNRQDLHTCNAS